MKKPKIPGETREQRAAREGEEERIRTMQARADADEAAAGRRILTKKTRSVMRIFGARRAMSALGGQPTAPSIVGGGSTGGGGVSSGSSSLPLGYALPYWKQQMLDERRGGGTI